MENVLMALFGILVSLLFSYLPGLREKYASFDGTKKRLIMLGVLLGAALLVAASSCLNLWVYMACDANGFKQLAEAFFAAVLANQATFLIIPKPESVYAARDAQREKGE